MAENTSVLTFQDLLLRVAEYYGVASYDSNGMPYVPVDDNFNLYECKKLVNDAVQMFISRPPTNGRWRWMDRTQTVTLAQAYTGTADAGEATTLTDTDIATTYDDDYFNTYTLWITAGTGKDEYAVVTDYDGTLGKFTFAALSGATTPDTTSEYRICRSTSVINADPARYTLSADFAGSVGGSITYTADSNHGTPIEWRDINYINERRSLNTLSGYPSAAAIRPYQPTSSSLGSTRLWEIIFDPEPQAAGSVQFPYTLHFNKMLAEGGTADSTSTTTLVDTDRTEPDDYFNTWICHIISGTGKGSYAPVTDYVLSTGTITVADWLDMEGTAGGTDPAADSKYLLVPAANLPPMPLQYDDMLRVACLAKCEMDAEDAELGTRHIQEWEGIALPTAWSLDSKAAPRKLGKMSDGKKYSYRRIWNDVTFNT